MPPGAVEKRRRTKAQLSRRVDMADRAEITATDPSPGEQAMSDVSVLLERIDAEFSTLEGKIKRAQDERLQEHQDRQKRLTTFKRELDSLSEV